ncbi:uncharacterized protein LOC112993184 [Dromaius novaehollandiae]|uniref:uncharacterized protein LOC112993184 n=1 Tax=Dromaius novaehollandiae TaxID=8790 RepID=UPI00311F5B87
MVPQGAWCFVVALWALVPAARGARREDDAGTASALRVDRAGRYLAEPGDPREGDERCGLTFRTPSPCSPGGPPPSPATRDELDHLKNLLQDTRASLKRVETAAKLEDGAARYQDIIAEALPAIHGANLEFRESLDNVRKELEVHVAEADHPEVAEKRQKLRKGVRVLAHVLRLTGHLAEELDAASHHLGAELGQHLQRLAAWAADEP